MPTIPGWRTRLALDVSGQDLVEYALLAALVAIASIIILNGPNGLVATMGRVYSGQNAAMNALSEAPGPAAAK